MRVDEDLPHRVRELEHLWVPLPDGLRLAARLWLPEGAGAVPGVLEYIPYRKRDGTRLRDEPIHRWLAGHGYACLRVDLRGSGESDGILLDEYHEQELADGLEVLRWMARQPWCSGRVGMLGKSWGGFNALQIAALAPPELGGIVTVCSTDDRYADDVHYMGGCLLTENLTWGSLLFTLNAQPPDPELVGEAWLDTWRERLERIARPLETWLEHPTRDAYWRRGSVCEDYGAIRCPVFAAGGWADGYSNAVPRLVAGLRVPRRGLVGPWGHHYPHTGVPGPAIGFLQEVRRFFDECLKGLPGSFLAEPAYRAWMRGFGEGDGRWVAEETWPSPWIETRRLRLTREGGLAEGDGRPSGSARALVHRSPLAAGLAAGSWCGIGFYGEPPLDQREDDAWALAFESEPLERPLEILGAPVAELVLALDRPLGLLAVRLNEVAPDGASQRVTYGVLNLAHRAGHVDPEPLVPGRRESVRVRLCDVAHRFRAGHRLRLALSTSYWPLVWPAPELTTLTLDPGGSALELPVREPRPEDGLLRRFDAPVGARAGPYRVLRPAVPRSEVLRDPHTGEVRSRHAFDADERGDPALFELADIGLTSGHATVESASVREGDPLSAHAEVTHETLSRRGRWEVGLSTRTALRSTAEELVLETELRARHGGRSVCERRWEARFPRRFL